MTNAQINVAIYHITGKNLDYVGSLDAMHEVEKVLNTTRLQNDYQTNIAEITYADAGRTHNQVIFNQLTATATQRAEAFLRTLNLWDDTK